MANIVQDKELHNYKLYNLYFQSQAIYQLQYCKQPLQDKKSPLLQTLMLKPNKYFGYEDIRSLWELKFLISKINITKWLKNLQLKAIDVLKFQFHRQYMIGFLVAGIKIQVAIFGREDQFIEYPVNYRNRTKLVSCLVADLTASKTELCFSLEEVFVYLNLIQYVTIFILLIRGNKTIFWALWAKSMAKAVLFFKLRNDYPYNQGNKLR